MQRDGDRVETRDASGECEKMRCDRPDINQIVYAQSCIVY